jgi:tetratricopeptide (TPR) repeat protein
MLLGMRVLHQLLPPLLLVLLAAPAPARAVPVQLLQAQRLSEQGQSRGAIALLEPLVQGLHVLDGADLGIAWTLLGNAYQDFENYDKARRCYENAIHILEGIPDEQVQYATAVDNLGAVEFSMGNLEESKALRSKARRLHEAAGNHAGVAIACGNLAVIALKQNDVRAARRSVSEAFSEAALTKELTDNNLAMIFTAKGYLAKVEKDFHAAVDAYQEAIDLWTRCYGSHFFMLGTAYALRGQIYDMLGDHKQALGDFQQALTLLEKTPGRDAPAYLMVEIAYAHALRDAGAKEEAARLNKEAKAGLANARVQQCGSCTISAESFR